MIRHLSLLCLLSLQSLISTAQSPARFAVTGQVRDVAGKPLEFATVLLLHLADSSMVKGAVSDVDGKYSVETGKEGQYIVLAQQVGYRKTYSAPFSLTSGQPTYALPALLVPEATQTLGTVTVTAKKPFIEQLTDRTVINVESSIISAGGTALEVLEKAPGVSVDTQNERISLKGRDGTLVMIDGKPTYLSAQEVVNLLRNTPANSVERIELIANPSAKYDAAGNAGIIDIRLKRGSRTETGTNGSVTLGAGYGQFPKTSAGLILNHRRGALSLFGNYNYEYRKRGSSVDVRRQFGGGDSLMTMRNLGEQVGISKVHTYKLGADYTLDKRNSVGVLVNGLLSNNQNQIDNDNTRYNATGQLQQTVLMGIASNRTTQRFSANANYKHLFDTTGQELTVDADFSRVTINPQDNLRSHYLNPASEAPQPPSPRPDVVQRNLSPSTITIRAAKADYILPLGKQAGNRIEAGGKISYVTSDNDVRFETLTETGYVADPQRTNHFLYDETITAGYLNGSREWGKWSVQGGLRVEHTRSMGNSVTLGKVVNRSYTDLFPSTFLTYNASQNHKWQASYSRRIDRPSYQDLNPFIYVLDAYTYREGNPFLRPQYTNTMQVGYSYKDETTVSLSYNHTTDVIEGVNDQLGQVLRVTTVNLAALTNVNLSVGIPLTLTTWWTVRQSADVFLNAYNAEYAGLRLDYRQLSANLTMNHNFVLPHGLTAEVSGFYNSPAVYGTFRTKGMGQISVGVQKSLWNKTATLRLNVSDVLNILHQDGSIQFGATNLQIRNRFESRVARLSFTYNFGKRNQKNGPARQRRSGVEDEQGRIGGNGGN